MGEKVDLRERKTLNNVNKTLYIPLFGKALISKKGIILQDKKAEEIWEKASFPLKGKSKSKWLAYFMGMRSAVFDQWVKEKIAVHPEGVVLHLGCGLDSRVLRVAATETAWVDIDFPSVIEKRKQHYAESETYRMLPADIRDISFVDMLPSSKRAIVLLEGVSMYLSNAELQKTLSTLHGHFPHLSVLVDCYTPLAARMSKIKNPIRDVGVSEVFGVGGSSIFAENTGLTFVREREITPQYLIDELDGRERRIFKALYAGRIAKKLYTLYEYEG